MIAGIETDGRAVAPRLQRIHPRFQRQRTTDGAPSRPRCGTRLDSATQSRGYQNPQHRAVTRARRWWPKKRAQRCDGPGWSDSPIGIEIGSRVEYAPPLHFRKQKIAHAFVAYRHDRESREHRVTTAAHPPKTAQRQRERVPRRHQMSVVHHLSNARTNGPRDVDDVIHAADDVEVLSSKIRIDSRATTSAGLEVLGRSFEKVPQRPAVNPYRHGRALIGIKTQHVTPPHASRSEGNTEIERRRGRQLCTDTTTLHVIDEIDDRAVSGPRKPGRPTLRDLGHRRVGPRLHGGVRHAEAPR